MDKFASTLIYWLSALLVIAFVEWKNGSFEVDAYQTYTFVVFQAPLHYLVVYASICMMHIGYHLAILEDCNDASNELK